MLISNLNAGSWKACDESAPCYTDKKEKKIFSPIIGNLEGSGAKSYMTNDLLINGENICAFPHKLGSPPSYMTLHPLLQDVPQNSATQPG